ncbi:cytochrome P450 [Suillus lakei]|nr:cytochrome P450 [Suillus lakei]
MSDLLTSGQAVLAVFAISLALRSYFAKPKLPRGVQIPPGPALLPILGSALAIDVTAPWLTYKDMGYSIWQLFGQDNIVINSERVARDLLEHRSHNYSDRPEIATNELFGIDYTTAFMRYGSRWRLHRKILHQSFRQDVITNFRPMQGTKTHDLLLNLLEDPLDYPEHLEVHAGSVIMSAVYSYDAVRRHDHMIDLATQGLDIILKEMRPEVAAIFSAFPSLLRLPSWLPGMRLKRVSPLAKRLSLENLENPFAHTEHGLATGSISSCMVADHLLELDDSDGDSAWRKKAIKESAATAFGAAVLMNFILVMILHPDVQQKAHELVDSVVGARRLPTFHDRPSLSYIDAILRECMRWRPVFPLAIMHAAVESDVYEGYYIPKGATVTPNVWAMCHNEDKYANASEFNPERFLNPDGTLTDDTVSFVWGFGRRICPGRHLAEASIWSAMVCMLAAKDETGREIEIEPKWHGGLTVRPVAFPCSITPRNADMDITALQHLIRVSI